MQAVLAWWLRKWTCFRKVSGFQSPKLLSNCWVTPCSLWWCYSICLKLGSHLVAHKLRLCLCDKFALKKKKKFTFCTCCQLKENQSWQKTSVKFTSWQLNIYFLLFLKHPSTAAASILSILMPWAPVFLTVQKYTLLPKENVQCVFRISSLFLPGCVNDSFLCIRMCRKVSKILSFIHPIGSVAILASSINSRSYLWCIVGSG